MVAFILPANSATGGYEIDNSLRFNDGDSPSMTIASLGSSSSNAKKWTVSFWAKLSSGLGGNRCVFSAGEASGGEYVQINFTDDDELQLYSSNSLGAADDTATNIKTNAKYRDVSAWYNVVWAIDFTDGTAGDRIKLYVNGSRVTSFASSSNIPAQDTDNDRVGANNIDHFIGKFVNSSSQYVDAYLSDFYFIDGDAKAASDFGETNDNGVWIPIKYTGSFGNNGFKLEFQETGTSQNSSGIGADTSGNDNHFAVSNLAAIDVTTDTPTNNFCTLNPLDAGGLTTFSEGNCKLTYGGTSGQGDQQKCGATMGAANGKWYWEMKSTSGVPMLGVMAMGHTFRMRDDDGFDEAESNGQNSMYANNGTIHTGQTNSSSWGDSYTDDDIIGVALDMDNQYVYFSKNGTFQDSGDPTSGSSGTGASDYRPSAFNGDSSWGPFFQNAGSSTASVCEVNFGNPPHAISSGNADANGYGNFEYAVPSGYFALCTKNLAEYG